eukprot:s2429_g20.t1
MASHTACRWIQQLSQLVDQTKSPGAPEVLCEELPSEEELSAICLTVMGEVRRFESLLQAELVSKAKHNWVMHPSKIFKDFAKPAVSPVSILQDSVQAVINEVDPEDCSVTLQEPAAFWPGELATDIGPKQPIITCDDKVRFGSIEGLQPGQTLRQEKFAGQLEEMFARFQSEWQSRWDKHLHTPADHWDSLLSFFQLTTPPGPAQQYQPITRESWYKTLKRKNSTAAQGPDGWTRQDLLQLPADLTDAIIAILNRVEAGQMTWPQQWLVEIVQCLEKFEQPAAVNGYRPITNFL